MKGGLYHSGVGLHSIQERTVCVCAMKSARSHDWNGAILFTSFALRFQETYN